MSKKLIIKLSIVGILAVAAVGGTIALFNDTETSNGNILVAGELDLKVDHLKQTYNGVDCNTCNLTLVSDPTNMVVAKNGAPVTSYAASYVSWIHPAWTAQNDPALLDAGAKWIWEAAETKQEDTTQTVTYTFEKAFEWYGPIITSDLWFAIGSDNSIVVKLNGVEIASNPMEFGYQQEHMLHIPAATVTSNILQGSNVLTFEVTNWALANGTPQTNPAGLIYKFFISGNCQDSYFKSHCQLWGETDLTNQHFWMFDDVKPGDRGTNVISLHVYDNDAWACLMINNKQELENTWLNPEKSAGDVTENIGELSQFIKMFGWNDIDKDGVYEPGAGETALFSGSLASPIAIMKIADSTQLPQLPGDTIKYVGFAWCFGDQSVDDQTGTISCDGSAVNNIAQSDTFAADLTAFAEQWRNNPNFTCASLAPNQLINGGFEDGTNGWTVSGSNQVVSSYTGYDGSGSPVTYNPKEGSNFLVLTGGATNVYTIASQQVDMLAGQKLQGWAAYDATDYTPFVDDADVDIVISGPTLVNVWEKDVYDVGNYGLSPWEFWSWTAPADGTYTLELKVRNTGDDINSPSALFDANVVTP